MTDQDSAALRALHPIFAFLDGDAAFEGVWFGDKHPTRKGTFWWRTVLREALAARQLQPAAGLREQEDDAARLDWLEGRKYREARDGGYSAFYSIHLPAMAMGPHQRDHGGEFDHQTLRAAIDAQRLGREKENGNG